MKNRIYVNYFTVVSTITLALLVLLVLVPQSESLQSGVDTVRNAGKVELLTGAVLMLLTYVAATLTLQCIALRKISFKPTLLVQFASGFASKLVPAGIGGFALNTRYLNKQKHSMVQAGSVMALNGLLGFLGHNLILIGGLVFYRDSVTKIFAIHLPSQFVTLGVIALLLMLCGLGVVLRKKFLKLIRDFKRTIWFYRSRPYMLLGGFIGALVVTILFTAILYLSAVTLGVTLSLPETFIAYTAMSIGAAVTPTPGGIGGAEAALTGILVALGLDTANAFAIALIFRFITYWLPIVPGYIVFQHLLRRHLI